MTIKLKAPVRRVSAAGLIAPARKAEPTPVTVPAPLHRSAAGLTVPPRKSAAALSPIPAPCRPLRAESERRALFDRLRTLRDELKETTPNKNDQAIVLIAACILGGICRGPNIVSALVYLGFSNVHAGATLHRSTGSNPQRHKWCRDSDGRYRLLKQTVAA